ncbi:wnt inhibitory factor 1-like [Zootermopsis nevadensis]|uniref:EB domain-containing protein n=1 Tax=Zootermopsis nevadensis TaxID=136037 RepID=A0A067R0Z1_ZOONE|nr:wnt inhibitory factor 1-like [Zootermopsis nevadensis]KDR12460.1 hypothetical protein L798_13513 [Zootermopsis nevadensis]
MAVIKSVLAIAICILCQLHDSLQEGIEYPAEIGTTCTEDDRCKSVMNSVCSKDVCSCKENFVPSTNNKTICLPVARNVNNSCEEEIQCTMPFGENGTCNDEQQCVCKTGNHYVKPSKCVFSKGLNEQCAESNECFLPEDGENQKIECNNKQCKCRAGYIPSPDEKSCRDSAVTNIISITCIVGVWVLHLWL